MRPYLKPRRQTMVNILKMNGEYYKQVPCIPTDGCRRCALMQAGVEGAECIKLNALAKAEGLTVCRDDLRVCYTGLDPIHADLLKVKEANDEGSKR
jgi:hypothetical protein